VCFGDLGGGPVAVETRVAYGGRPVVPQVDRYCALAAVGVAGPIRRQGAVAAARTPRAGCEYAGSGPPLAARRRLDEMLASASAVVMSLVSQQSDQF
jgi:hypothetical protein